MKKSFVLALLFCFISLAKAQEPVRYFEIGDTLKFNGQTYHFAWSSHPQEGYYIQEYLPQGQSFDNYKEMFTVTILLVDVKPDVMLKAKIMELEKRKKTDEVCNYLVVKRGNTKLLDFLVSDGKDDRLNVVEMDLHRYERIQINNQPASMLCFYSARGYGDDILPFIKSIADRRESLYNAMEQLEIHPVFNE